MNYECTWTISRLCVVNKNYRKHSPEVKIKEVSPEDFVIFEKTQKEYNNTNTWVLNSTEIKMSQFSNLLTPEENGKIQELLGRKSISKATAVVQLHTR